MEFRYDTRDLRFIVKEWLPAEEVFACERFRDNFSLDDVDLYLNEGYKIAREVVFPINGPGDKIGARLEKGVVTPAPGTMSTRSSHKPLSKRRSSGTRTGSSWRFPRRPLSFTIDG